MRDARGSGRWTRTTIAAAAAMLLVSASARAHEDPPGCFQTGPAIVVSIFRANGTTGVVGSVSQCENINYQVTLSKASNSDTICAFSAGTFSLTTPDGVVHTISANVPCIGGTSGEGCDPTVTQLQSNLIPYAVKPADVVGGFILATGQYTGGVAHDNPDNTPGVAANTPKSTPVTFCTDNNLCTNDLCDPNAAGPAACSHTPVLCPDNDLCTTEACNPANGQCETTSTVQCDDNNLCTTQACIPATGECETTGVVMCDDNDPCTDDMCNPATGQCVSTPNNNPACVGLRHFQCYEIKPFAFARRSASVEDQFVDAPVDVRAPNHLCAPSDKNGEDPTAPADPQHLAGFPATGSSPRVTNVQVTNQFGTVALDLVRRTLLLVPTAKNLTSPPGPLPPTVDHFQCYLVRRSAGAPRFTPITGVAATDQFGAHGLDLRRPKVLCVPANKNDEDPTAPSHSQGLLCYKTKQRVRFGEQTPFIDNQFLAQQVEIVRRIEFCVPSTIEE